MKCLTDNGHRKIALYINDKDRQYNRERLAGALEALGECGIEDYEKYIVRDVESEDDAYYKTLELMRHEERPTGCLLYTSRDGEFRRMWQRQSGRFVPTISVTRQAIT